MPPPESFPTSVTLRDDVKRCSAEIGYWLGEQYWGRGIATRALAGFTPYAFETYGVDRIEPPVDGLEASLNAVAKIADSFVQSVDAACVFFHNFDVAYAATELVHLAGGADQPRRRCMNHQWWPSGSRAW